VLRLTDRKRAAFRLKSAKELAMKKTTPKKLMLSRETLGHLNAEQARAVLGRMVPTTIPTTLQDPPWTSDSVRACCA
jgi:hypothetical protein